MILETKCIREGVWVGIIHDGECLCSVGNEGFRVITDDKNKLPGLRMYPSEQHVLTAFMHYAGIVQQQEEEEKRLKSLARKYEFKDGKIVPYEEPF